MLILLIVSKWSMVPPTAFSSDQLIDPQMSLDPQFLVPVEDSVGSDPTKEYTFIKTSTMTLHLYCHPQRIIVILRSRQENF